MSNIAPVLETIRDASNSINSPAHREIQFDVDLPRIRVDVVFSRRLQPILEWPTEEYIRLTRAIQLTAVRELKDDYEITMQDSVYVRGTLPLPMKGLTRLVCAFTIRVEPKKEIA